MEIVLVLYPACNKWQLKEKKEIKLQQQKAKKDQLPYKPFYDLYFLN